MATGRMMALCAMSAATLAATAGTPIEWASPVDGNWSDDFNWTPAVVPGMADAAELGMTGAYIVTADFVTNVGELNISNPDAQLDIPHARSLTLFGSLNNNGLIVVNSTNANAVTTLDFGMTATLSGSGSIMLNYATTRARLRTLAGAVLTQGASHSITGEGQVEAELVNNGLVSADVPAAEMVLNVDDKTNNATMEAVNGAVLELNSITLTQSATGDLVADGVDSQVEISNATVIGGDVMSVNGADVEIFGTSTLDGIVASGVINIPHANTLHIMNSIENNGVITVNSTDVNAVTTLRFLDSGSFNGSGSVVLNYATTRARLQGETDVVVTQGASHSITGEGQVEAELVNNGLVSADVPNGEMLLNVNDKTNNATMQAVNESRLEVSGITLTQSASGDLIADGVGSQVEISGSTVSGGDVMSVNGADVEILGTSTLDGIVASGVMNIPHANTLNIMNSIENNGVITLNSTAVNAVTTLKFIDTGSFNGSGTLAMNFATTRARLQGETDVVVTQGASHSITGQGQIEAELVNNGVVSADVPAAEMVLNVDDKINNATMEAVNGAVLELNSITLTQSATGDLVADGVGSQVELSNSTVDGGDMTAQNDGIFEVAGTSHIKNVNLTGTLNIPHATNLGVGFGTLNNGLIEVNSTAANAVTSLIWDEEIIIGGAGTIRLNFATTRARLIPGDGVAQGGLGTEQRLEGVGQIDIDLINHGTIAPGLSVGTMTATQPIFNSSAAVFEAEVNDAGADLLDSTSTIEIHGTLDVSFIDGFAPTGFWSRTVMEGSSITGQFDVINEPTPTPGLKFRYYNTGTEIRIGASCNGDIDLNNTLDVFDVFAFLDQFSAQDPIADLQPDGIFDIFDVFAFLNAFNAGGCG